jgi:hypothetical protein
LAVDTPAKIAILGAGPIGLEAALYARFLGYEVEVFDHASEIANSVLGWAHRRMLRPFAMNGSTLGAKAIAAHGGASLPGDDEYLSYGDWRQRYLIPLAHTDLIADCLRLDTDVHGVGKVELGKTDCPSGEYDRGAWDFRLITRCNDVERVAIADVVLDCTGRHELAAMGHGGIGAVGEADAIGHHSIVYSSEADADPEYLAETFANKSVLIVGDDITAAYIVIALADVATRHPSTQLTWATRHSRDRLPGGPFDVLQNDPVVPRAALLQRANNIALSNAIRWLPGEWIEFINKRESDVLVEMSGEQEQTHCFDRIIRTLGEAPMWYETRELQLDICPITDAPRPFSEYLLKRPSPYSVEYPAPNPQALITSEPNYYVLGSKSFGRMPGFLYQHGLRQIRDVFTIIGDRADLDLYAQMK